MTHMRKTRTLVISVNELFAILLKPRKKKRIHIKSHLKAITLIEKYVLL